MYYLVASISKKKISSLLKCTVDILLQLLALALYSFGRIEIIRTENYSGSIVAAAVDSFACAQVLFQVLFCTPFFSKCTFSDISVKQWYKIVRTLVCRLSRRNFHS